MTDTQERTAAWHALAERAERARVQALAHCAQLDRVLSRTRVFDVHSDGRPGVAARAAAARIQELESTVDGLTKRLASQAPVEQAKGIIMAQTHCDPDHAFEVLRRASQRSNIKLRVLAEDLVAKTSKAGSRP